MPKRSLRHAFGLALILVVISALGLGVLVWRGEEPGGIDEAMMALFGKPDLGPVDFARLRRPLTPNDALACPADVCPAKADLVPPDYPVAADRLRAIIAEVALAEPRTELVYSARWEEQDRYVARSRVLRFPDTIDVMVVSRGEERSTLALYSRAQLGLYDFGVNRRRLARWLDGVTARATRPQP
ncbi:MAG TPA: DUF1499 domain-containing protein [Beijerinckiaceae bacterium]